jgi:hypothetical protein
MLNSGSSSISISRVIGSSVENNVQGEGSYQEGKLASHLVTVAVEFE